MNLYQQIQNDIKEAMKGKDLKTLGVLRVLFSSLKNKSIDLKRELEDQEVLAAVRGDIKKLQDALQDFEKAAREDLVSKTSEELAILKTYLPPEMDEEELRGIVKKKITELNAEDMKMVGKVIGAVMADVRDKVDGSKVKKMVEELLATKKDEGKED
ncbi:MAG: GatB/YqeY domain-containing protein [Patescibacteria group bacterium]|nr:GatB/YqeY domain-containing protein [Patescibacteria group bacterium]